MTGTISRLIFDRGFGFLTAEDDVKVFFHASAVEGPFDALAEGQRVTFERGGDESKGPRAIRVAPALAAAADTTTEGESTNGSNP